MHQNSRLSVKWMTQIFWKLSMSIPFEIANEGKKCEYIQFRYRNVRPLHKIHWFVFLLLSCMCNCKTFMIDSKYNKIYILFLIKNKSKASKKWKISVYSQQELFFLILNSNPICIRNLWEARHYYISEWTNTIRWLNKLTMKLLPEAKVPKQFCLIQLPRVCCSGTGVAFVWTIVWTCLWEIHQVKPPTLLRQKLFNNIALKTEPRYEIFMPFQ